MYISRAKNASFTSLWPLEEIVALNCGCERIAIVLSMQQFDVHDAITFELHKENKTL